VVIASLDDDADIVPFFVGLTFRGGVEAWAAHPPFVGRRRVLGRGIVVVWLVAAIWVALLLAWYVMWSGSRPPPLPEATYLGLTAFVYHAVGLFGGAVLMLVSAFGPDRLSAPGAQPAPGPSIEG
jgi:hypothetical protein